MRTGSLLIIIDFDCFRVLFVVRFSKLNCLLIADCRQLHAGKGNFYVILLFLIIYILITKSTHLYVQIHMLEERVKQLEKQVTEKEAAMEAAEKEVAKNEAAGKEAAEKEAVEKEVVEKEATKKEAADKEAAKKEDNDEEEDQSWPSGSSDDDSPVRLHRVKHWFKCPICFNNLYQHKNSLFLHIQYMMMDEFSPPDMVEQNCHLNRLIEARKSNP
jgi:flagellar biosynthesis GTPase FlhF